MPGIYDRVLWIYELKQRCYELICLIFLLLYMSEVITEMRKILIHLRIGVIDGNIMVKLTVGRTMLLNKNDINRSTCFFISFVNESTVA